MKGRLALAVAASLLVVGGVPAMAQELSTGATVSGDAALTGTSASPSPDSSLQIASDDRILFLREGGEGCATIHTIAADGSDLTDIPGDCLGQAHARWEPSHTSILLDRDVSDAQRAIFRVDLATGEATQLSTTGPWDWDPAVSPDGRTIAFDRASDVRGLGIMLIDADGSNERRITTVPAAPDPRDEVPEYSPGDGRPSFSPDGHEIVFARFLSLNPARFQAALFIVGVDGEGLRQVTDWLRTGPERPTWSPDGSTILFGQDAKLWTVYPDGTGLTELRPADWSAGDVVLEADWSPDGSRIVFKRWRSGWDHNELWTMGPDGSDPTLVLDDADAETPDW